MPTIAGALMFRRDSPRDCVTEKYRVGYRKGNTQSLEDGDSFQERAHSGCPCSKGKETACIQLRSEANLVLIDAKISVVEEAQVIRLQFRHEFSEVSLGHTCTVQLCAESIHSEEIHIINVPSGSGVTLVVEIARVE